MYFLACACLIKNMKNFILKVFIFYGMEEPTLSCLCFLFLFFFKQLLTAWYSSKYSFYYSASLIRRSYYALSSIVNCCWSPNPLAKAKHTAIQLDILNENSEAA